jgi:hypothetical protein
MPSEIRAERHRDWRTRPDPFAEVWAKAESFLENNEGLEAKTLFAHLQREHPVKFSDGQLRTFQRRVKVWRATEGPSREVCFPQEHTPGRLSQSDFTHMAKLRISIDKQPFDHLIFHFVLTYSNWETGMVCFSESFESLSEGLQRSLWEICGVPELHQTDSLSAAVQKPENPEEFTARYQGLLDHYGLGGRKTNPASPHENGDIEQRHHRFKKAVDQALLLRGSRDFCSREEYEDFLRKMFAQLNQGRRVRFQAEQALLRPLPAKRLETCTRLQVRVGPGSTIRVKHKVYSVNSRLIKELVDVRLYPEHLEVWYGQRLVEEIPRLCGGKGHYIQYRHVIDWLIRKPGAFENYKYRNDMFPTSRFRVAYDLLCKYHTVGVAAKEYLALLQLAAKENETAVDDALRRLIDEEGSISSDRVAALLHSGGMPDLPSKILVQPVALTNYDQLLQEAHG